jgi:hypothetical protein
MARTAAQLMLIQTHFRIVPLISIRKRQRACFDEELVRHLGLVPISVYEDIQPPTACSSAIAASARLPMAD